MARISLPFAPIPASPSAAEIAAKAVQFENQTQTVLTNRHMLAYANIWSNPGQPPQAIIAAMGTQAQKVFSFIHARGALINQNGGSVPETWPSGWTITDNPDGSITALPPA